MSSRLRDPRVRVLGLALAAFFLYGGYALGVNLLRHDAATALRAGLGQGTSSAVSTLIIGAILELFHARLGDSRWGLLGTWLIPPTLTGAMHAGLQWALGTPDVLLTVAFSVVMGYVFAGIYVWGLLKLRS